MKRSWRLFFSSAVILTVLGLGSCDLLYSGKNLFSALDGPDVSALKSATSTSLIDALLAEQDGESGTFGDTFVEKITADPEAVDTIYSNLEDIFTNSNTYDPDTRVDAASLAAELILATSDTAGAVIDNVVSAIVSLSSDPENTDFTADELAVALLSSIAPSREAFIALATDLDRIASAYDALGSALVDGGNTALDAGDGQTALIAFTLSAIVDAVQVNSGENPAEKLYDQLIGPALRGEEITADIINNLFSTSIITPNGADNLQNALDSVLQPNTGSARDKLYTATGIASLINLLGGN
ncbi:hypothetical protein [Gracilinema caldarium]|uniref:hypothetical protein n=1 Tax=Gracilinema caldarium TaxID=215591 RepID=UPI0026F2C5DA|nr:hypothetical protein [Gracilinema caldarium]